MPLLLRLMHTRHALFSCTLQVAAPFNIPPTPAGCQLPYCTIWRMNKDGSSAEVYASGACKR